MTTKQPTPQQDKKPDPPPASKKTARDIDELSRRYNGTMRGVVKK